MLDEIKLIQKKFLFGQKEFILKGKEELFLKRSTLFSSNESSYPLYIFDIKPESLRRISVKWLIPALILWIPIALIFYQANNKYAPEIFLLSGIFFIPLVICFYRFYKHSMNFLIFCHAESKDHLVYFWKNRPNIVEFEKFINELKRRIDAIHYDPKLSCEEKAVVYKRHVEFLQVENVLSEKEADQLYKRIDNRVEKTNEGKVVSIAK